MEFKVGDIICYSHGNNSEIFKDIICVENTKGTEYFYGLEEKRNMKSSKFKTIDLLIKEYFEFEEIYILRNDEKYIIKTFANVLENIDKYPCILKRKIFDTSVKIIQVDNKLYYIEKRENNVFYKRI